MNVVTLLRSQPDARLSSYNKKMPIVLGIDPSIAVDRSRSIGCANGKLLEDVLNQNTALADGVEVAVFAVGVDRTVGIHHSGVHAPLKAVGMVGNTGDCPIRIACAALGVGVLKAPDRKSTRLNSSHLGI